jgi:xanthine dehydrogenase accessory factor
VFSEFRAFVAKKRFFQLGLCPHMPKTIPKLSELTVVIKGAGEMASAVAWRFYMANIRRVLLLEIDQPVAVRRKVAFCEAVYDGRQTVEGVEAVKADGSEAVHELWSLGKLAVCVDPRWELLKAMRPDVLVDAILAKRNLGTALTDAPLVVALGPGFFAGQDAHMVIETNRGHNLGRIITCGSAEPDTGVPGPIGGQTEKRILRAPAAGVFQACRQIGNVVRAGETVGFVDGTAADARLDGVLRGLIRSSCHVTPGLKIGDIDPRKAVEYCTTISDKARAVAGAVLEAVLRMYNTF